MNNNRGRRKLISTISPFEKIPRQSRNYSTIHNLLSTYLTPSSTKYSLQITMISSLQLSPQLNIKLLKLPAQDH